MKRLTALLLLLAAVSISAVATAPASTGKATPFKVTYGPDEFVSTCSGSHVESKLIQDSETCVLSGSLVADNELGMTAGKYTSVYDSGCSCGLIDLGGVIGVTGWFSDYFGFIAQPPEFVLATSWTVRLKDNHNGTWTQDVVAFFPS